MTPFEFANRVKLLARQCSEPALLQWLALLLEELRPHAPVSMRLHIDTVLTLLPNGTYNQLMEASDRAATAAYCVAHTAQAAAFAHYAADAGTCVSYAVDHAAAAAVHAAQSAASTAGSAATPFNCERLVTELMLLAG